MRQDHRWYEQAVTQQGDRVIPVSKTPKFRIVHFPAGDNAGDIGILRFCSETGAKNRSKPTELNKLSDGPGTDECT